MKISQHNIKVEDVYKGFVDDGEDGIFEGVLETIGIPYAGCNTLSSANGMDKITMKQILKANGVPVVDYTWFTDKQWFAQRGKIVERIEAELHYPVIVKPANLGTSVGIGRAANREQLIEKVDEAEKYSTRIIVEHMVEQLQEINCSVLGDCDEYQMSALEEPIKSGDILSYEDKYMGGSKGAKGMQASEKRIPAELPEDVTARIKFLAGETFRAPEVPVLSNVTGRPHAPDADSIRQAMVDQVTHPVRWLDTVQWLRTPEVGAGSFVEFGPGKTLSGLVKRIDRDAAATSIDGLAALDALPSA